MPYNLSVSFWKVPLVSNGAVGKSDADMFVALREILHDPFLMETIQGQIESQHLDAGSALTNALESFRRRLLNAPDLYLRERASDLLELQGSLLDALASSRHLIDSTKPNSGVKGNCQYHSRGGDTYSSPGT